MVNVIDGEGNNLGTIKTYEAIKLAQEEGLDLVEVSPNANPPVCKMMDYGKFKYNKSKKSHDAKKKQKVVHIKEVKLTPKTDKHDIDFKINHVKRFIAAGDKAKVTVVFKGREMSHPEVGMRVLKIIEEAMEELAIVEQPAKQEGRNMSMIFAQKAP
ncbi:MAG: translation initiation factor IF-3 [Nitrospinae bacterium]|nr:translation initiation factor IF-3 [Nitrospinota bacterium]